METVDTDSTPTDPAPRSWQVLCVDDEPNILSAMKRLFRGTGYQVHTAESGQLALELLASQPINLIISDMRMPGMDGAQLLEQVRERWPAVTRLLLTGYSDVESTIAAINRGQIHRYITKPWNDEEILLIVRQAFERVELEEDKLRLEALAKSQHEELKNLNANLERKVDERTAELAKASDRLKKNYMTSIKAFSGLIEQRGDHLTGHARRVADVSKRIAQSLGLDETASRDLLIAALLHDIGQIGFPDALLAKPVPKMTEDESLRYRKHTIIGEQTLMALDDMQAVGHLIRSHHERYDGLGFPDGLKGEAIPLGARILAMAETYDDLQTGHLGSTGVSPSQARTLMANGRGTQYDPQVFDAFMALFAKAPPPNTKPLSLTSSELRPGMVLAKDFMTAEGVVLLAADLVLTADLIARFRALEKRSSQVLMLSVRPAVAPAPTAAA